jgi:hypothetical protein
MNDAVSRVRITAIDDVSRVMAGIRTSVGGVSESLRGLAAKATALVGAGGLAAYLVSTTRNAIDLADSMDEVAQKTGLAVRDLSALAYAAKIEGVSVEALQKSMKGLSENVIEAGRAGSQAAQIFDALGVDAGANLNTVMEQVADSFAQLEDGALKTTIAAKLFGKAGQELIPLLNQGSEGLIKARREAEAFGLVVGEDFAKQAGEFNDNLTRMSQLTGALGISIAQNLVPALNSLIGQFLQARAAGLGFFEALSTIPGPNANKQNQIEFALSELKKLEDQRARVAKSGGLDRLVFGGERLANVDAAIAKQRQYLDVLRAQAQAAALVGAGGTLDARDAQANPAAPSRINTWALRTAVADPGSASKSGADKQSDFEKLSGSVSERIRQIDAELAGTGKLTEADKLRLKVIEGLSSGQITLTEAQRKRLELDINQLQVSEQVQAKLKDEAETRAKIEGIRIKEAETIQQQVDQLLSAAQQRRQSIEEIGLEGMALVRLKNARLQATIAEKEAVLVSEQSNGASEDRIRVLELEIKLLREQKSLNIEEQSRRDTVKAGEEAITKTREEAKRLEDALANSMMMGFQRGGVSGRQIGDQLRAYFATLVLKPIIDPIAKAGAGLISQGLEWVGMQILGGLRGGGIDPGGVQTFATGGVTPKSGFFDVGEAGRERVFLPKGAEVFPAGRVAIADQASQSQSITVNTTINPPAKADQAWLADVEKRIRESTMAAILSSRKTGGTFARGF